MTSLTAELERDRVRRVRGRGTAGEFGRVQPSDRSDLAQFQCNGALAAAKEVAPIRARSPGKIAARLKADPLFAKVEIAGRASSISTSPMRRWRERLGTLARDDRLGAPETGQGKTLVIDFGGPNVAKPMHVGHLRSAIIGDCLQRLFRANAWHVVSDVHLGDWGLQMGQLISEIGLRGLAPIYFDAKFTVRTRMNRQ